MQTSFVRSCQVVALSALSFVAGCDRSDQKVPVDSLDDEPVARASELPGRDDVLTDNAFSPVLQESHLELDLAQLKEKYRHYAIIVQHQFVGVVPPDSFYQHFDEYNDGSRATSHAELSVFLHNLATIVEMYELPGSKVEAILGGTVNFGEANGLLRIFASEIDPSNLNEKQLATFFSCPIDRHIYRDLYLEILANSGVIESKDIPTYRERALQHNEFMQEKGLKGVYELWASNLVSPEGAEMLLSSPSFSSLIFLSSTLRVNPEIATDPCFIRAGKLVLQEGDPFSPAAQLSLSGRLVTHLLKEHDILTDSELKQLYSTVLPITGEASEMNRVEGAASRRAIISNVFSRFVEQEVKNSKLLRRFLFCDPSEVHLAKELSKEHVFTDGVLEVQDIEAVFDKYESKSESEDKLIRAKCRLYLTYISKVLPEGEEVEFLENLVEMEPKRGEEFLSIISRFINDNSLNITASHIRVLLDLEDEALTTVFLELCQRAGEIFQLDAEENSKEPREIVSAFLSNFHEQELDSHLPLYKNEVISYAIKNNLALDTVAAHLLFAKLLIDRPDLQILDTNVGVTIRYDFSQNNDEIVEYFTHHPDCLLQEIRIAQAVYADIIEGWKPHEEFDVEKLEKLLAETLQALSNEQDVWSVTNFLLFVNDGIQQGFYPEYYRSAFLSSNMSTGFMVVQGMVLSDKIPRAELNHMLSFQSPNDMMQDYIVRSISGSKDPKLTQVAEEFKSWKKMGSGERESLFLRVMQAANYTARK